MDLLKRNWNTSEKKRISARNKEYGTKGKLY